MKTVHISAKYRKIFVFEAETLAYEAVGPGDIILQGTGRITEQDSQTVAELHATPFTPGVVHIEEDGEEVLHGDFLITLMELEPDRFTASIANLE